MTSYYWGSRSNFAGGGQNNGSDEQDGYGGGGQQYEGNGGKKRPSSRLKKSSGTKKDADADEEYPKYANGSKDEADLYNSNSGSDGYSSGGYNGGTLVMGTPYGGGYGNSSPYRGGGSGYGNSGGSPYGGGGGGYGNGAPYGGGYGAYSNAPPGYWAPQDGARSPMVIHTNEVHLHGGAPPGYDYDGDNRNNDQRRRGGGDNGGGGFFGPALHAVGHFFDRKLGFRDRD